MINPFATIPVLIVLICLCAIGAIAQEDGLTWRSNAVIKFMEPGPDYKGTLVIVQDSSLVFSQYKRFPAFPDPASLEVFSISGIETLKIRKKNADWIGAVIGGVAGFVMGGAAGYMQGDSPPGWFSTSAEEKALISGTLFLFPGVLAGIIIGTNRKKYRFEGQQDLYEKRKDRLRKYEMKGASKF